tara:strand:- start:202 stop:564 length:363 start_codon:yes stop_codon:yes gene_type:complete
MPYSQGSFRSLQGLDRNMFVIKADVGQDEVEELVQAYEVFTNSLMKEVCQKLEALEDAKASAVDIQTRRGYTKRLNKIHERLNHLEYVARLGHNSEVIDKVEAFKRQVVKIDDGEPGKLI